MIPPKTPAEAEIHVWFVDLGRQPEEVAVLASTLAADELARARAFRAPEARRRFVVTRGALRGILAGRLDCAPEEVEFTYSAHGKPELSPIRNPADFRFNVSHSGELALVALTAGARIGVDVEQVRPLRDMDALIRRFFSAEESTALHALSPDDRLQGFFACWTRKEAYLKATGSGLTTPLDRFTVSVTPGEPPSILHIGGNRDAARSWRLVELSPPPGYRATLAVEGTSGQVAANLWIPEPS